MRYPIYLTVFMIVIVCFLPITFPLGFGMKITHSPIIKEQDTPLSILDSRGRGIAQKKITEFNRQLSQITLCLSGRVAFSDGSISNMEKSENLDAQFIIFTSLGAGVQNTIPHSLGRIPVGYIVVKQNMAGASLYHEDTDTKWTTSNIYLKSDSNATTYTILIF